MPNPDKPLFFVDFPVVFPSGELVCDIWEQWLSFDPVVNYRGRLDNLAKLGAILLDVGCHDDYHLQWGHRLLSHYLRQAGVTHEVTEHAGNHGGRYQLTLQWLVGTEVGT